MSSNSRKRKIERLEKKLAKYRKMDQDETAYTSELEPELSIYQDTSDVVEDLDKENNSDQENLEINPPEDLDSNILMALGTTAHEEGHYAENIHEEIYKTIKDILVDGLPKQFKEELMKSFMIPNNCRLLDAPLLNTELNGVMSISSKSRDKLLLERQQEIGLAIAGTCQTINDLSKKDFDKLSIIKRLSNISRILSNLHYQHSVIRRKLCNPFIDKSLAESLKGNRRETFLYSNLEESVKCFTAMKKASQLMKPRQTAQTKPTTKNYQQPPRRLNHSQAHSARGPRGGAAAFHQARQPTKSQDHRQPRAARGRARYP